MATKFPTPWRARADVGNQTATVVCTRAGMTVTVADELTFEQATEIVAVAAQRDIGFNALQQVADWFTTGSSAGLQPPIAAVTAAIQAMTP